MLNTVLWRLHAVVALVALLFFGYKLALLLLGQTGQLRTLRARTRWADSLLLGAGLLTFGAAAFTYAGPLSSWLWAPVLLTVLLLLFFIRALRQERKWMAALLLLGAVLPNAIQIHGALFIQWPHQPNLLQQALLGQAPNAAALAATSPAVPGQPETTATTDADAPVEAATQPATPGLSEAEAATIAAATSETAAPAAAGGGSALAAGQALFAKNCVVCHGPDGQRGLNGAHDLTKSNLNTAGRVYLVTNGLGKMPAFQGKLTDEQIQQVVAYSLTLR